MSRRRSLPLRMQPAVAIAACVLATVAIGYGGLTLYGEWQGVELLARLPPEAQHTRAAIEAGRLGDDGDLLILMHEGERLDPIATA